jgi:tetratricopeptide (TPR) repeat protein
VSVQAATEAPVNRAPEHNWKTELHRILCRHFSEDELHTLCLELEIDYEDLGGVGKSGKARELVAAIDRRNLVPELVRIIQEQRPSVSLSEILEAAKKEVTATLTPQSIHSLDEAAAEELLNQMGQDHRHYPYALACKRQLSEIIEQSQLQGDTDQLADELQEIIDRLDRLALDLLDTSFRELSDQTQLTDEQEKAELPLNDPLSLVELRSEGLVWHILESVKKARANSNWNTVLRLCDRARKCQEKYPDQAAQATAQLYSAEALAQSGQLQEGIDDAERAISNFKRQSDHRHEILAHLLRVRLRMEARQNLDDARQDYQAVQRRCEELKAKIERNLQQEKVQFFDKITRDIELTVSNMDQLLAMEQCQSCRLNAIPILQLAEGPDTVFEPAKVFSYLATEGFRIAGERRTYLVHRVDEAESKELELKAGSAHFALPVPENGWPSRDSRQGQDFVLVRARDTQEGPGVRWTGQEWSMGRFERDPKNTDKFRFVPKRRIIGGEVTKKKVIEIERDVTLEEYGYVIGLLKPEGSVEMPRDS